ncbi:MAG: DUF3291 domain-containing protein [Pseudomonadota bacterium]
MALAEFNIAHARWPLEDPRMADFRENTKRMNALAARSPGFLWRLDGAEADALIDGDPRMTWTLSVWETAEALAHFAFRTVHRQFFRRRAEWFPVLDHVAITLWEVAPDARPTLAEALQRKARLDAEGPGAHAFGWERFPHLQQLRSEVA